MSQENTTNCQACRTGNCFGSCLQGSTGTVNDPGQEAPPVQGRDVPPVQGQAASPAQENQPSNWYQNARTSSNRVAPSGPRDRSREPPTSGGWVAYRRYLNISFLGILRGRSSEEDAANATPQGEPSPGTSAQVQAGEDTKTSFFERARSLFFKSPRVAPSESEAIPEAENQQQDLFTSMTESQQQEQEERTNMTERGRGDAMTEEDREEETNVESQSKQPQGSSSSAHDDCQEPSGGLSPY